MPEVSVLMPVYNTKPAYLKAAIESILVQEYRAFEFIVLNDSPENAELRPLILSYRDPRLQYCENPQTLGVAPSYNRLLELAKGEFIAMMNHDDIALPRRLDRQYAYLQENPSVGLVGTGYKKFGEINRFKTVFNPADDASIRAALLFKSPIHHPTIMFRRSLAQRHNLRYNESFVSLNDRQFYCEVGKYAELGNLKEVLYKYRFHKDMVSKRLKPEIFKEQCLFHEQWFKSNQIELSEEEKNAFDRYASLGRCRIKNIATLNMVNKVLERLASENLSRHFAPEPEFSNICAGYLVKRCLNAAICGGINSAAVLEKTTLPVPQNMLLKICNLALRWGAR